MKVAAIAIGICFTCLLLGPGCSKDEPSSYPEKTPVVRKVIQKPLEEKSETTPPASVVSPQPEVKEEKEIGPDTVEADGNNGEPVANMDKEEGVYITDKGDSLSSIAGREDFWGDPLKWSILYRLNREKLKQISKDTDLPDKEIPVGTRLDIITPEEAQENLEKREKNYWVVNVISSPEKDRIVPNVIKLADNGYPVYITLIEVKGKDWMRIRVGFFKDREEAEKEGEKIIETLNLSDIWTTKVGDIERGTFGGY
jgi:hypothetical protein